MSSKEPLSKNQLQAADKLLKKPGSNKRQQRAKTLGVADCGGRLLAHIKNALLIHRDDAGESARLRQQEHLGSA